jgi:hypothetical protein
MVSGLPEPPERLQQRAAALWVDRVALEPPAVLMRAQQSSERQALELRRVSRQSEAQENLPDAPKRRQGAQRREERSAELQ